MQISKSYSGTVTLESATVQRDASYGGTTKLTHYPTKVNTFNQIVADFLSSVCKVDAYYGYGNLSDHPFLWIYGVPFLFGFTTNNNYPTFYSPKGISSRSCSTYYSGTASTISFYSGNIYNFTLYFAGNPDTGFYLRFKSYSGTAPANTLVLRFMKAENLINGSPAVLWSPLNYNTLASSSGTSPLYTGWYAADIPNVKGIDIDSITTSPIVYTSLLYTVPPNQEYNEGVLPLIPLMVGPYRVNGIYLYPRNFALPKAVSNTMEIQTEITIGNRSFLITCDESMYSNTANMGLIETT